MENTNRFTFVNNKGWRNNQDRGGTQFLVQSYMEEFTDKDNVSLIIKINPAYGIPNVNELVEQLRPKNRTNFAPIKIIADEVPYEKMPELYASGDVFVSPTMAEGFSLPCAEAMAMGLPVITTDFGGQTDFVTKDNGWLIDYELKEVTTDIFYEGINWAMPDIAHLRKLMRWAYEHPEDVKKKGKQAIKDIASYTWESSARKLLEALK